MEPNRRVTFKIDPEVRDFDVRDFDVRDSDVRDSDFGHSFISPNNHELGDSTVFLLLQLERHLYMQSYKGP
jgi:hypothetical protein